MIRNTSKSYRFEYHFSPVRGGLAERTAVEIDRIIVELTWEPGEGWTLDADPYGWNLTAAGKRRARQARPERIWNERFLVREYGLAAVHEALLETGVDRATLRDDAQIETRWTLEWAQS